VDYGEAFSLIATATLVLNPSEHKCNLSSDAESRYFGRELSQR
jgi:hypothetical protein